MATSLFLMRHGPAEAALADRGGNLTEAGVEVVRSVARGLRRMGVELDAALSSPLPRAEQTARLVVQELGLAGRMLLLAPALQPGAEPAQMLERVQELRLEEPVADRILLVGHMPDLAYFVHHLAGRSTRRAVGFTQAGVARIDFADSPEAGRGELRWSLRPEELAGA